MIDPAKNAKAEKQIIEDIASFTRDPLKYVLYAFPWGEKGSPLEEYAGPDKWQREFLERLGKRLREGYVKDREALKFVGEAIQMAVASGHGIGKSALVAWLILWAMSTFEDTRGVVTANTKTQLSTKTWAELAKWHSLAINSKWFIYESTSLHSADPKHEKTWRIDAIPWSKHKAEAFAGLHNKGKRILLIFDEASAIEDIIYETAEGALTDEDTEIMWFVFGNPTRNTGRFRECWRRHRSAWKDRWQIDARDCKMTNKRNIQKKLDLYGLDSDYSRVRILGQFPHVGDRQFIGSDLVEAARGKHIKEGRYMNAPKILTLDNAWTGSDEIVIGLRQGLVFSVLATFAKNDDDGYIAGRLSKFEDEHKADAVFIDAGYGQGVFSFGKRMGREWILVSFGGRSSTPGYRNKRSEMWGLGKEWLKEGGCLPNDDTLCEDLIGPEFDIVGPNSEIQLESKDDMKDRGLPSPNRGDAWALSFAFPVIKKGLHKARQEFSTGSEQSSQPYNPFS